MGKRFVCPLLSSFFIIKNNNVEIDNSSSFFDKVETPFNGVRGFERVEKNAGLREKMSYPLNGTN